MLSNVKTRKGSVVKNQLLAEITAKTTGGMVDLTVTAIRMCHLTNVRPGLYKMYERRGNIGAYRRISD